MTVSTALIRLFCFFGVCKTLISDNGTEFTAEVTKTVCRLFQVPQEFTPSYIHHCLGACERTHRTLAEKLTPYVHSNMSCWESVLPMIVFAMNNAVHSTTQYSPFEVVFLERPRFPLFGHFEPDLKHVPLDLHRYVQNCSEKLTVMREQVLGNIRSRDTIQKHFH